VSATSPTRSSRRPVRVMSGSAIVRRSRRRRPESDQLADPRCPGPVERLRVRGPAVEAQPHGEGGHVGRPGDLRSGAIPSPWPARSQGASPKVASAGAGRPAPSPRPEAPRIDQVAFVRRNSLQGLGHGPGELTETAREAGHHRRQGLHLQRGADGIKRCGMPRPRPRTT